MERSEIAGPGLVRVLCNLDGRPRAVRVQLEPQDYDQAIDSHKNGNLVSITGTLIVERQQYRLEKPTDFRTIEQLNFLDEE
ncbi:MAG: hypothetical protein HC838_18090 [Spirulinaceae cyanobacterium RM2_2_10]|nr:hypothetical protein [Spirulinaceae cyanobacterium RM2_2_10]